MEKILVFLIVFFIVSSTFAQKIQDNKVNSEIKNTVVSFLKWYKANELKLQTSSIIRGYNQDTIKKDSLLRIDMNSVDEYLSNFKKSNYVSDNFLGSLRAIYKSVADTLLKYPTYDYSGPVPGLECDLLFGFEPEEILDHVDKGKITKFYQINNIVLLKFEVSRFNQLIFTLRRNNTGKWMIESLGYDASEFNKLSSKK